MPLEYWVLLAVAAAAGIVVGVLGSRRSRANPETSGSAAAGARHAVLVAAAPAAAAPAGPAVDARGEQLMPADQLGIGLINVGRTGTVAATNRAADDLLGSRSRGLVGKSMLETFLDHTVEELVATARREGHAAGEYSLSGEPQRTVAVNVWQADQGAVWIALTDVSELQRLRRIRTEFVDNLSHELRTPLSTVRLLTESLSLEAERTELPPRVRESIAKIDVETGHLVQMVNELLDLAKIEQGDTPLRRDTVDMARVVDETIGRLRVYAERQNVELKIDKGQDAQDAKVLGDEDRLSQVLANLVHNAIKFSPAGAEVLVHVRTEPENVLVEVEDYGPGIPTVDRNRIFERFYKVDRARSRGRGGTGLGLAIARHIVERHRGHIWVQSEEGRGSKFFVSLPRADQARADQE